MANPLLISWLTPTVHIFLPKRRILFWSADLLLLCTSLYLLGESSTDQLIYSYCAHISTYLANPLLIYWLTPTLHITLPIWRIIFWSADWLLLCTSLYLHGESYSDQLIDSYCAHLSTYVANPRLICWLTPTVHISLPTWRILFWSADWLLLCTSLYQHAESSPDQLIGCYCAHNSTNMANHLLISWLVATVTSLYQHAESSSDQLIGCYCAHLSTNMANPLLISWLAATVHITLPTWRILFWSVDWLLLFTSLYLHGENPLLISWCKCRRRVGIENNGIVTVWWEYSVLGSVTGT